MKLPYLRYKLGRIDSILVVVSMRTMRAFGWSVAPKKLLSRRTYFPTVNSHSNDCSRLKRLWDGIGLWWISAVAVVSKAGLLL